MVKRRQKSTRRRAAEPEPTIRAWQDDPATGFLTDRPVPNLAQRPLAFSFPGPTPKPASYQPGTPEFRYWTAAEALRRGANFWAQLIPLAKWQPGPVLKVLLDEGLDFTIAKHLISSTDPHQQERYFLAKAPMLSAMRWVTQYSTR